MLVAAMIVGMRLRVLLGKGSPILTRLAVIMPCIGRTE